MNERIKLHAEQAGAQPVNLPQYVTLDWQKFAELVVTDCCQMMLDLEVKYSAGLTVLEIKKQFGLK